MYRSDRDKVWKLRRKLKGSQVNIGRFFSAKITLDDCQIVLAHVYAPNNINQQVKSYKKKTQQVCTGNDDYWWRLQLRSFTK